MTGYHGRRLSVYTEAARATQVWRTITGSLIQTQHLGVDVNDGGYQYSKGNPFSRMRRAFHDTNLHPDIGGNYLAQTIVREGIQRVDLFIIDRPLGYTYQFDANQCAHFEWTTGSFLDPSSAAVLYAQGATAIARCIPTNPQSNMGQFLVELREPPRRPGRSLGGGRPYNRTDPQSWRDRAKHFRNLARNGSDEYLNVAFGWLPFIQDIRDFIHVTRTLRRRVIQFNRDSGRLIRRSYRFPHVASAVSSVISGNAFPYPAPTLNRLIGSLGVASKTTVTQTDQWFKGAFTYYLPPVIDQISWLQLYETYAHHFYGLRLDPDLLWRLAPWSWAVDWFSNAGDIARNWSAFTHDNLTMAYGYIMETKSEDTFYSVDGATWADGRPANVQSIRRRTSKVRYAATPFGFGLNPATFSAFQLGIIAALGINRGSRWL